MWYKGKNVITQGKDVLHKSSRYAVDDDFSLHIRNSLMQDSSAYQCKVLPDDIKLTVNLKVLSEDEVMKGELALIWKYLTVLHHSNSSLLLKLGFEWWMRVRCLVKYYAK